MKAYLFDTGAVSEVLRKEPSAVYLSWLQALPRELQYISSVSVGELYKGAYRSAAKAKHLKNINEQVLPRLTVLPYDTSEALVYGQLSAELEAKGTPLADADLQIAATAVAHDLELVTGNLKHFARIDLLSFNTILADDRSQGG